MTKSERWLTIVLRLGAVVTGSALLAVFLPVAWMAEAHGWLGLGDFPATPIVDYLTRSLSAMYALHGLILLALSLDVGRHLRVISWVGWGTVGLGALQLGIDLHAPMPLGWVLAEGPVVVPAGLVMVWLAGRARVERRGRSIPGIPLKEARS